MTTALIIQPIDELTVFLVPNAWRVLPEDWREELGFWYVIKSLQMQQDQKPAQPILYSGPPREFDYTFASTPEEMRAVVLRHDCGECRQAREEAAQLLESDPAATVCLVQFTQDYIYTPETVPDFRPKMSPGPRAHTEVDFGG